MSSPADALRRLHARQRKVPGLFQLGRRDAPYCPPFGTAAASASVRTGAAVGEGKSRDLLGNLIAGWPPTTTKEQRCCRHNMSRTCLKHDAPEQRHNITALFGDRSADVGLREWYYAVRTLAKLIKCQNRVEKRRTNPYKTNLKSN